MEASQSAAYGGRGPEIMGVSWILTAITTIIILLTLYVRFFMAQQVCSYRNMWSIVWAVLAWLFGVLGTSFLSVAVHFGYGNHDTTVVTQGKITQALLYTWIWLTFSTLTVVWAKFSVVAYFLEIQRPTHMILKSLMIGLVGISLCSNIVSVFLSWFQCDPVKKGWKVALSANCRLEPVYYDYSIYSGSWSAFVDLFLTLYPIYIIYRIDMAKKLKMALGVVLASGLFACVCACMRTYELRMVQQSVDKTWDSVPLVLWSTAESWIILIALGIPQIWPVVHAGLDIRGHRQIPSEKAKDYSERPVGDIEAPSSVRMSANTYATMTTDATTASTSTRASNALTLNDSLAGQRLNSAIAVKREVTIDREDRRSYHGSRPRADTRSWARADSEGLARWSSTRGMASPLWTRKPSWVRELEQT